MITWAMILLMVVVYHGNLRSDGGPVLCWHTSPRFEDILLQLTRPVLTPLLIAELELKHNHAVSNLTNFWVDLDRWTTVCI